MDEKCNTSYKTIRDTRSIHIFVDDCKYYLTSDEGFPADCDHMKNNSGVCNPLSCPINTYRSYGYKIEEYYKEDNCSHEEKQWVADLNNGLELWQCTECPWLFVKENGVLREPGPKDFDFSEQREIYKGENDEQS